MSKTLPKFAFLLTFSLMAACSGGNSEPGNDNETNQTQTEKPDKKEKPASDTALSKPNASSKKGIEDAEEGNIQAGESVSAEQNLESEQAAENEKKQSANDDSLTFILQCKVNGAARSEVILDKLGIAGDSRALASTVVNKGDRFKFGGKIPRPGLYRIRFPASRIIVVLKEGVQRIKADFDNLENFKAKGAGAKGTMFIKRSFEIMKHYNKKGDSLRKVADKTSNNQKMLRLYDTLDKRQEIWNRQKFKDLKALVRKAWDANSVAAPAIAIRTAVQNDIDFFEKMHADFKEQYPENYFVKKLGNKLENARDYLERQEQ